ncbi:putative ATP-grasp-modified RiPP [Streptosporangium canum]|uniref:putative ATP-grasp-modified RiPP n=1 Tax=Streptosporangium canum TaxID=324952 RepID=UPI00369FFAA8
MMATETTTPWGLTRMTRHLPVALPLYATFEFAPETQVTNFYDAAGAIVDMGNKVTVTMSKGGGGDGSSGSKSVADDSQND